MNCEKKYASFIDGEIVHFNCKSLRNHYAEIAFKEGTNPAYLKQIRDHLMACLECTKPRVEWLRKVEAEHEKCKKFLTEYEEKTIKVMS